MRANLCYLIFGFLVWAGTIRAETDLSSEIESLRKEIQTLRKEKSESRPVGTGVVDKMVDNKYGPDAKVTTKQGKLRISGLLQIWYYCIENDNLGFFGDRTTGLGGGDTNEGKDNDSFAIRRARLGFTMDIHENVQAYIQMGLEFGFGQRAALDSNLGLGYRNAVSTVPTYSEKYSNPLTDAYVRLHGLIPHHEAKIGQYLPRVGFEGALSAGALDFVERSMIGQFTGAVRDVGVEVHGTWMDDRLQYWLGAYNSPNDFLSTTNHNCADTNDYKSFLATLQVRPVWKDETWGSLELGGTAQFNTSGESGDTSGGTDGLNREETDNIRYYGWASYAPGGPVRGWWLKSEYAWIRARMRSGMWVWNDAQQTYIMSTSANQANPRAFDTNGWYVSTGYKLSDSIWKDELPSWLRPAEFTFRYETFGNIQVADLARPNERHDVWKTSIYTAGLNYYIKGHNAKVQINYNWVCEPDEDHDGGPTPRLIREVNNDNLVVNFQVSW